MGILDEFIVAIVKIAMKQYDLPIDPLLTYNPDSHDNTSLLFECSCCGGLFPEDQMGNVNIWNRTSNDFDCNCKACEKIEWMHWRYNMLKEMDHRITFYNEDWWDFNKFCEMITED